MLSKKITYTNFEGVERTKEFYFNLTKAEVFDMELQTVGGMERLLKRITETEDTRSLIEFFKKIIYKAYGEKSEDGEYFTKLDSRGVPLADRFVQTEAYSELFIELLSNPEKANAFIMGVLPQALLKEALREHPELAEAAKTE